MHLSIAFETARRHLSAHRVLGFVVLVGSLASALPLPAAPPAKLAVPAHASPLQVAVPMSRDCLPPGKTGCQWQADGVVAIAQPAAAVAPDGLPDKKQTLVLSTIPGKSAAAGAMTLAPAAAAAADFSFKELDDKSLQLVEGDKPVLTYNFGIITNEKVPAKEPRRSRACYVHPLWGLNGEVLTDDFPKDHFHHHGVFWSWPHVSIDGKQYDLWAGGAQSPIHQRFVGWLDRETGPVAAVLGVENGWFVGDEKVMIERVWIRAFRTADDARAIDFELVFIPVQKAITLRGAEGKSYGGLTVRFIPGPRAETLITVPSGKTTADLPDTPLAWADFTSKFAGQSGRSGAAIFVPPDHPDYPPTWLTRYYGPLCVGWPGVKDRSFPPGEPIRMCYRIWIHKAAVEPAELKTAYESYEAARKAAAQCDKK